jgi:molybdopterin-guanine dinucleotide biosynthesis protein A
MLGWSSFGQRALWLMVVLVDHPFVRRSTFEALLQARLEHPQALLWTPTYGQRSGHTAQQVLPPFFRQTISFFRK